MKRIFKWIGWIVVSIVGLLVVALLGLYVMSNLRMNKRYAVQPAPVTIPIDDDAIAEGRRQFLTHACLDCHGADGAGVLVMDDPLVGHVVGANLTPGQGGAGQAFSDDDWIRAIRHGIGSDGKPLIVMPSYEYNLMNDEDLGNLIAYLKRLSPVDQVQPTPALGPLGRFLIISGLYPVLSAEVIDHEAPRPQAVAKGETAEFGHYLVAQSCVGCHGEGLSGGAIPGVPPSPPLPRNLTPDKETGLGEWQLEDFVRVIRQGERPDGTAIDPTKMPWPAFQHLTDEEIRAIWLYLQSLPATPFGNR